MKMSAASGALRGARPFVGRGGRRDCTPVCRLCARRDDDVSYSLMLPEPRAHLPWDTPRATAATSATSTTSTTSDDDDDDDGDEEIRIAALQLRGPRFLCCPPNGDEDGDDVSYSSTLPQPRPRLSWGTPRSKGDDDDGDIGDIDDVDDIHDDDDDDDEDDGDEESRIAVLQFRRRRLPLLS